MRRSSRLSVLPLGIALLLSATACGGGGDDTSSATTKAPKTTTEAPTTTVKVTVPPTVPTTRAPITIPVTQAPVTEAPEAPVPDFIDPSTILTPWEGTELQPITVDLAQSLIESLTESASDGAQVTAAGAVNAVDATGALSTLVFIEFGLELTPELQDSFAEGVIGDGTDATQIDANGLPGYVFIATDGTYGFVSARPTTGVLITSPTEDALVAAVQGLFTANPAL